MNEVFKSIKRTPYQSLGSFLVLFFTLFLSLILFIFLSFFNGFLNYLETQPQVTVYFKPKTPEDYIFKIKDELSQSGKVLSIKYISQNEAYNIYRNLNKDNPLLLEMVSADILPASLEVYAKKPIYLPEIAEYLKKQSEIDEVQYQKDIVNRLLSITNILRKSALVFFAYLILMSTVVLTSMTLFKIALKKEEIELLRLLGATNSYIRWPYIKEALFMGTLAATSALVIILLIIFYFNPFLKNYLLIPDLTLEFYSFKLTVWPFNLTFIMIMYLLSLVFGLSIAVFSSYLATNKYLKV
ncbi:MAG: cell division protein FtsX [Microgenomates group bacterium]